MQTGGGPLPKLSICARPGRPFCAQAVRRMRRRPCHLQQHRLPPARAAVAGSPSLGCVLASMRRRRHLLRRPWHRPVRRLTDSTAAAAPPFRGQPPTLRAVHPLERERAHRPQYASTPTGCRATGRWRSRRRRRWKPSRQAKSAPRRRPHLVSAGGSDQCGFYRGETAPSPRTFLLGGSTDLDLDLGGSTDRAARCAQPWQPSRRAAA